MRRGAAGWKSSPLKRLLREGGALRKMVRPEGFEPPTNGFGSHYSIRLSYERVLQVRDCSRMTVGGLA